MRKITSFTARDISEDVSSIDKELEQCSLEEIKSQLPVYKGIESNFGDNYDFGMSSEEIKDKAKRAIKKHFTMPDISEKKENNKEILNSSRGDKVAKARGRKVEENPIKMSNGLNHPSYQIQRYIDWATEWAMDNGIVDKYLSVNKKSRQVSFDYNQFNKDQTKAKKQTKPQREKDLKKIAKEIDKMDFKIPNDEAAKDFHSMMEITKNNPTLDVSKMNAKQKAFNKEVISPVIDEISKTDNMKKGGFKKVTDVYSNVKKASIFKEIRQFFSKVMGLNK